MTMFFRNASEPAKEVPAPKKKKVKCCPFWPVVPATLEEDEPEKATCESRTERAKAKALVTAKSRAAEPLAPATRRRHRQAVRTKRPRVVVHHTKKRLNGTLFEPFECVRPPEARHTERSAPRD